MQKDLSDYRKSYKKSKLLEDSIPENPMELFQKWFYEVMATDGLEEPNAMTVSTIGLDGFPKNRIVLLKKYTDEGFLFYTNYHSEKGKAISQNSKVGLSFFWHHLERQVIIKGQAEKIAENLSDDYFESRPRGSQLGAIVSQQSKPIKSRMELENNLEALEAKMEGKSLKRPKHWGGYLIKPVSLEFWQGRPNRLHDRIRYILQNDYNWKVERLQP